MADGIHYIKRHDRRSVLRVTLLDDETPVNLSTAASVRLLMSNITAGLKVDALMTKLAQSGLTVGQVEYAWQAEDTDTTGSFRAEIEVVWAGSYRQTFPADSYFKVKVVKDLNDE